MQPQKCVLTFLTNLKRFLQCIFHKTMFCRSSEFVGIFCETFERWEKGTRASQGLFPQRKGFLHSFSSSRHLRTRRLTAKKRRLMSASDSFIAQIVFKLLVRIPGECRRCFHRLVGLCWPGWCQLVGFTCVGCRLAQLWCVSSAVQWEYCWNPAGFDLLD